MAQYLQGSPWAHSHLHSHSHQGLGTHTTGKGDDGMGREELTGSLPGRRWAPARPIWHTQSGGEAGWARRGGAGATFI